MNRRSFLILGTTTAVLLVIALGVGLWRRVEHSAEPTPRLLPQLEARLNDITRVRVRGATTTANLERRDNRWQVTDKSGYPVDLGLLRQNLFTLAHLERVEAMTRNPDKYDRLGLQPVDRAGSEAREVTLWVGEQEIARVTVGNTSASGGSFVRVGDDPQTWLASARFTPPSAAADWLNRELISLTPERIRRIDIKPAEGTPYSLIKTDPQAPDFTLDPPVEGDKKLKTGELRRTATALNALRLDDVVAADQAPAGEGAWNQARFETFDGLVAEAQSRKHDNRHYLKLKVAFDPALAPPAPKPAEAAPPATANPAPSADAADRVKAAAEQYQNRVAGWVYVIPDYPAFLLNRPRDELFEAPVAAGEEPPAETHEHADDEMHDHAEEESSEPAGMEAPPATAPTAPESGGADKPSEQPPPSPEPPSSPEPSPSGPEPSPLSQEPSPSSPEPSPLSQEPSPSSPEPSPGQEQRP